MASRRNHTANQPINMRDKPQRKANTSQEHRSNFRAGFIPINEEYLHKTGIRGSKKKLLYGVVAFLLLVAIGNMVTTALLLSVLKLTPFGLECFEFLPGGELLRFIVNSFLPNITLIGGQIGSRMWSGMNFTADQSTIYFGSPESSMLSINKSHVLYRTDAFDIVDPKSDQLIFSTDPNKEWSFPEMPQNFQTDAVEVTNMTSSNQWEDIVFETYSSLTLKGDQSVGTDDFINKVYIEGSKGISLNAREGNLTFEASAGNIIINKKSLRPIKVENGGRGGGGGGGDDAAAANSTRETFKLCICTPSGKLFAVPNSLNCLAPKDACNDA
ncbi:beta-sarcoglycan-like [Argonauta hians]